MDFQLQVLEKFLSNKAKELSDTFERESTRADLHEVACSDCLADVSVIVLGSEVCALHLHAHACADAHLQQVCRPSLHLARRYATKSISHVMSAILLQQAITKPRCRLRCVHSMHKAMHVSLAQCW